MTMFETNMFDRFETAKQQQKQLHRDLQTRANERQLAEALRKERAELRWFRTMFTVRHWLHRLAPRMARAML